MSNSTPLNNYKIMKNKVYQRKCVTCKDKFTPQAITQICCSPFCAYEYVKKQKTKEADKVWKKQKTELKEKLMTKGNYLEIAQKVFNTYIRLRDKSLPCISCGKVLKDNDINASHFFSVGSSPNLRFNEDNVHNSCIRCNKDLHGNLIEYRLRLPDRIGLERLEALEEARNTPALYTIEDIKEITKIYREKIKILKKSL